MGGGAGWGRVALRTGALVLGTAIVWLLLGWAAGVGGFLGATTALPAAGCLLGAGWLLLRWGPAWAALTAAVVAGLPLLGLLVVGVPANSYLRASGTETAAVITSVEHVRTRHGGYDVYRLAGPDGKRIEGELEGAVEGLAPGTPLRVVVDPLGVLAPRLVAEVEDGSLETAALAVFAAWTALVALTTVLGELAARRGRPLGAGLRRLVPARRWVRAVLITGGLAAVSLAEGVAIAVAPGLVAWLLGVPLGLAALASPFLLARAANRRVDGHLAWWPAWTSLLFAATVFICGCVLPKDAYLTLFGDTTTGVVATSACEQSGAGCYYRYTLTTRDGTPINGTVGDTRRHPPGTELPLRTDPHQKVTPQLTTAPRPTPTYYLFPLALITFLTTALTATLRSPPNPPTPLAPTPHPSPNHQTPIPPPPAAGQHATRPPERRSAPRQCDCAHRRASATPPPLGQVGDHKATVRSPSPCPCPWPLHALRA
ncbi:hypothetical protein LO762_11710 [Actinocorallia sp. API 0066]|uniref:hypothetical protein n=1 Tax=Actinocorallia sp. API 0066 TaxID=2896846 RepID=UPI001E41EA49|nr:hypothetical protein [Actinocorallia sp. API 0066]MCD0449848.1 hypothetical protein [Actinocorallia sp. API 0066]